MQDVNTQKLARSTHVTLTAKLKHLVMLFIRSFHAMRQVQLEPGIAFSAVIHVADDRHETGLVGSGVEDGMELPVQASPGRKVVRPAELADIFTQHRLCFREVLFRQKRYRLLQDFWLEQSTD